MKNFNAKKNVISILVTILLLIATSLSCTGCFWDNNSKKSSKTAETFGFFGYNGIYLYKYSKNDITSSKAKNLLSDNESAITTSAKIGSSNIKYTSKTETPSTLVNTLLSKYAACEIITYYYVDGLEDRQNKNDYIQGTDLKTMIEYNEFTSFTQLVTRYLIAYSDLIDYMEEENQAYKQTDESSIALFKDVFSYHTDTQGNLVIQTRDFAEIPSSVGGGIGCSFRQDTEILYDSENKISKWHTSLGVWSATPKGTLRQGYILEVQYNWILKK